MTSEKKSSGDKAILDEPELLLAVVITDSYDKSLAPCTLDRSRVLVPLANKPLIDYTLAFLSRSGIEEVIVYCTAYAQQIKSYIEASRWPMCMSVKVIINEDAQSVGDALRDLDDKQMVSTDFVLVNGDLVANFDLKTCLDCHKQTRFRDKNAILTKVMKKCPPGHRALSAQANTKIYAINKSSNQILSHMKVGATNKVKLSTELIKNNEGLQLRYDLLDCHVTLCAAMVPSLLTDNFDYQCINDLINGVLGNQEILGNTMHINVLEDGYAARATDLYSYKMVSQEVVDRWAYPFCPDTNWCSTTSPSNLQQLTVNCSNRYIVNSEMFSRSCDLGSNVIVGDSTSIGDRTVIRNSVVGNNCSIGSDVTIMDSIIWDRTSVEDGCQVHSSIICDGVTLYAGTQVSTASNASSQAPHCILGKEVKLGPAAVVTEQAILVSEAHNDEWNDEPPMSAYRHAGSRGKAYPYIPQLEVYESEEDSDIGSGDGEQPDYDLVTPDTDLFYKEVLDTLYRASTESISAENIILDINSLKHAYNIQINEVNHMVVQAVLDRRLDNVTTSSQLLSSLKPLLKLCLGVFKNYYRSETSQMECLQAIQEFVEEDSRSLWLTIICQVLMYLYQNDVLDEEVITSWYNNLPSASLKLEVTKLIEWFDEAESESD